MNKMKPVLSKKILLIIAITAVLVIPMGIAMAVDHVICDKGPLKDNCKGDQGNDIIIGTKKDNVRDIKISGSGGADSLLGCGGDDVITGGNGDDELVGDEDIFADTFDDTCDGVTPGQDDLDGGNAEDYITGGGEDDDLSGGSGAGRDELFGGDGDDVLSGGNGHDDMDGGPGDDLMFGGNGNDYLRGGPGNDILQGGNGADIMEGGDGNDELFSKGGGFLDGGPGFDICHVDSSSDIFMNCEQVVDSQSGNLFPVLTLTGSDPVNLTVGDTYVEEDATCDDPEDGNISALVVIGGDVVDENTADTYVVTYDCTDSFGNSATQITRTVNVIAGNIPVLTLDGSDPVNLTAGDTYVEDGATCDDTEDGDISASVVIGGDLVDDNTVGTYVVTYDCDDGDGNSAIQITRTVNVATAGNIPVLTLDGSDPVNLAVGDTYVEDGATCDDTEDGDISASVVIGGEVVDENTEGTYVVTYDCTDGDGNSAIQITRTVNVTIVGNIPVLTLVGSDPVNLAVGDTYVEAGATCIDTEDSDISASVVDTRFIVNTSTAGTYVVTYDCTDGDGNSAIQITRTVNVTGAPTIFDVQPLKDHIDGLVLAGDLDVKDAKRLNAKLDSAQDASDGGNNSGACGDLDSFERQVNRLINRDKIPIADGTALIVGAQAIQADFCV